MNLRTYLDETGTTQAELAAAVGCKPAHMSLLVRSLRSPSLKLAMMIERATDGRVPAASWSAPQSGEAS